MVRIRRKFHWFLFDILERKFVLINIAYLHTLLKKNTKLKKIQEMKVVGRYLFKRVGIYCLKLNTNFKYFQLLK